MLSKNNLVLYEIYPRSFQDSNGDGKGDLKGIIARLDYLNDLGVNALWLPPVFPSPMKDNGYDITDYEGIHPEFGTMGDFTNLVSEVHARGMILVLDLVVNHTSDEHPWFKESRASKNNPKRDWYIWHDPVNGMVPNNWKSVFDPSVWEFDKTTGQYYYHSYLKEQPDLNWKNPLVHAEVKKICAFWLQKGVDGLRLDGVNYYWKDQRFLDEPRNPLYDPSSMAPFYQLDHIYMKDQDEHYKIVGELAQFVFENKKSFLIPQAHPAKSGIQAIDRYKKYYAVGIAHNVMPFNFELIDLVWDAHIFNEFITTFLGALESEDVPIFVLGSHDRKRVATRLGQNRARCAAVLLFTLPGIPVIYYGEELGMQDVRPIPAEKITDTKELRSPGFGRDPDRTPMQWDNSASAGFSDHEPWLPIEKEYQTRNVAVEMLDKTSMLSLYKKLLELRNAQDLILTKGKYESIDLQNEQIYAFTRTWQDNIYLIIINFSESEQTVVLPTNSYHQLLSSWLKEREVVKDRLLLLGYEGLILRVL